MAYFNYRATDEDSRIIKGRIEASSEEDLETKLANEQLTLIEATKSRFSLFSKMKLPEKDLLHFTYYLNLILSSGVSIMSGLNGMAGQSVKGEYLWRLPFFIPNSDQENLFRDRCSCTPVYSLLFTQAW